ncbi:MAG TPA: permease [Candidatus Eisenbacteria bacterium]
MGLIPGFRAVAHAWWDLAIDILPLFLLAVLLGALIEEFLSERTIARFLTGRNPGTMLLASVGGALIPLCTCGMVPLAVSLRRRGGDLKHVFGFLTSGAAVSVPVLLLTGGVLDAGWAGIRFSGSVIFGLLAGYASPWVLRNVAARSALPAGGGATALTTGSAPPPTSGRGGRLRTTDLALASAPSSRLRSVLRRFAGQAREYAPWILTSFLLAAVVEVLVPRHWIHVLYGERSTSGTLLASVTGLPFYFCSGAELPLVKGLLAKGMGPGPAAAMMLAVPIVNIPTQGVVSKWLGPGAAVRYLALCAVAATAVGAAAGFLLA